jgi:prepilin-type N-terminal cleavage/methylation domain-containing protein
MSIDDVRAPHQTQPSAGRSGFTLVELLVVIVIIAMLAALITPAVMQSLTKARNAAIKAEIDMLHMALMNYQSEYGVLPPCEEPDSFWGTEKYTSGGPAAKHLRRLFPRCAEPATQLNDTNGAAAEMRLTQANAIVAWLAGYTTDPRSPLVPGASRVKLFDFDVSRIDSSTGSYYPRGKKGSPYIYFDSSNYRLNPVTIGSFTSGANIYRPESPQDPTGDTFFNPSTFQILCAGRDEVWGTDDDLSNFWPGTRGEYKESLKN